jgi:hypothetical protein
MLRPPRPPAPPPCTEAHISALREVTAETLNDCVNNPDADEAGNIFTGDPIALEDDLVFLPSGNCLPKSGLRQLQGECLDPFNRAPILPEEQAPGAAQAGAGHCQCKGPGVEQYMEGGHWWNDAWSSVKHAASTVGHDVSKAYHAVQNNPTVREVEKGVANFGVNTLARAGEGLVDAAADTASFVIGQPELAAAADMGVHELANLAQSGVKKGVDSLIDHTAQSGNGLMLPMPF